MPSVTVKTELRTWRAACLNTAFQVLRTLLRYSTR